MTPEVVSRSADDAGVPQAYLSESLQTDGQTYAGCCPATASSQTVRRNFFVTDPRNSLG